MGDEIRKLTTAQRLQLLDEIWDSLLEESHEFPLTSELREELDRRLEDCERNPNDCEPWEEVRKRLRDKL
ncbi:MAG: addiction module protein [Pirellulaceae bacterium]